MQNKESKWKEEEKEVPVQPADFFCQLQLSFLSDKLLYKSRWLTPSPHKWI